MKIIIHKGNESVVYTHVDNFDYCGDKYIIVHRITEKPKGAMNYFIEMKGITCIEAILEE